MNISKLTNILDLNDREAEALNAGLSKLHAAEKKRKIQLKKDLWIPCTAEHVLRNKKGNKQYRAYMPFDGELVFLGQTKTVKEAVKLQERNLSLTK